MLDRHQNEPRRFPFSLGGLLVAIALVALIVGSYLHWMVNFPHGTANRVNCRNNLREIAIALSVYCAVHDRLPPTAEQDESGKPMHSWRVRLLPYLGYYRRRDRYDFDQAWNGPGNGTLAAEREYMPEVYRCPGDRGGDHMFTCYGAITGPGTLWAEGKPAQLPGLGDAPHKIILLELANSGIHWMKISGFRVPLTEVA